MTIDEATALLEAYAELYHAAWYEDKASPSVCNEMRDMLAALIAKA